jgi:hypothetical protein
MLVVPTSNTAEESGSELSPRFAGARVDPLGLTSGLGLGRQHNSLRSPLRGSAAVKAPLPRLNSPERILNPFADAPLRRGLGAGLLRAGLTQPAKSRAPIGCCLAVATP